MSSGWWIRALGAAASAASLAILVLKRELMTGSTPDSVDVLLYLGLAVIPTFAAIVLSFLGKFWVCFLVGLWVVVNAVAMCLDELGSPISVLLLLCGLLICLTPFFERRRRRPTTRHGG